MEVDPEDDFSASLTSVSFEEANLIEVISSPHRGHRQRRVTDGQGEERCCFIAARRGRILLRQEERDCVLEPGAMALTDSRLATEYVIPEPAAFLGLSFPRAALVQRIGGLERLAARPLDAREPMHRFTYHYLERLFTFAPDIDTPELFRMKSHMLDLIAMTVGRLQAVEATGSAYRASLLHRMKAFVEERLHDPRLDIRAVADKFRVSPRYVSQLFRDEATTFNGFTRQRRLERCRRLLELSRANGPSIGEIAATVGFGSQAYLNKAFKRSFGTTPGGYRRNFQSRTGEP